MDQNSPTPAVLDSCPSAPDAPVEQDQLSIDGEGRTDLRGVNSALQVGKKLCVAVRREWDHRQLIRSSIVIHLQGSGTLRPQFR